jgi:hypothetical protein
MKFSQKKLLDEKEQNKDRLKLSQTQNNLIILLLPHSSPFFIGNQSPPPPPPSPLTFFALRYIIRFKQFVQTYPT